MVGSKPGYSLSVNHFLQILFREDVFTPSPPNARIFRFKTLIDGTVGRDYIQISQGVYRNSGIWRNTKGTSTAKTRKLFSRVLCLCGCCGQLRKRSATRTALRVRPWF